MAVHHLQVDTAGRKLVQKGETQLEHEIACLSLNPTANTAPKHATAASAVAPQGDDNAMAVDEPTVRRYIVIHST